MRPADTAPEGELYECFDCGRRVEDPETARCEGCGGRLRNLGKPRDL
ncbi:rubrerythrin-like domain-containing protein [Halovenus sp. WSH3]|uniref:Rubrerythrin-like domain-containing protein n=1 Tax=Halovenus carboxidivorans TaxID=2692199 RepID=A0A6B0SZL0_9EURY|nr:rubrerythrin-like domain-containing protein [Halovenus carboxidivorans]MXR50955.1 rubrerythrin-like domain-containing protein [Halovenus carboxidivorans]